MVIEKSRYPKSKFFKWDFGLKNLKLKNLMNRFKNIKRRKTLIFSILLILALITAAISSFMPLQGRVLTLHPKDFIKGFTEEGTIVAAQEFPLFSPMDGKLQSLLVHNGDRVKKDQVLFLMSTSDLNYQLESLNAQLTSLNGQRLQSTPYNAQLAQQKLVIDQAEKDVQAQEENLTKQKTLLQAGIISQAQYDEVQRNTEKAKNFLEQQKEGLQLLNEQKAGTGTEMYYSGQQKALEIQINQVQDRINKAKVLAPQDGIIKDLSIKEGTFLPQSQQVMTLFQNQGYKVESYVLASEALDIKPGSTVEIIQDTSAGKKSLKGQVETIDPSAVERISPLGLKENRVKVTITLDGTTPIVLGSSVNVKFTTLETPNKLMVPKTAVFPYQQGFAVWVIKNGQTKVQPVQKGLENDHDVIVEKGLSDGDTVLLDIDLKNLKEGKRIKAII